MNDEVLAQQTPAAKPGLTINALKYIAIAAMVLDHTAAALVSQDTVLYIVMRFIGRITGPVMFFAAAEAYHHTANLNRYMVRLAVFALVSYIPFLYFINGGILNTPYLLHFNVIYTIFIGVTAIRVRRKIGNPVIRIILLICLILAAIPGDWSVTGVLMILTFDYFYGNFKNQAVGFCLIVLLESGVLNLATQPFVQLIRASGFTFSFSGNIIYIINTGQFIPILLLYYYNNRKGRNGRFSRWFFYVFYPLHLLLLGLLRDLLK